MKNGNFKARRYDGNAGARRQRAWLRTFFGSGDLRNAQSSCLSSCPPRAFIGPPGVAVTLSQKHPHVLPSCQTMIAHYLTALCLCQCRPQGKHFFFFSYPAARVRKHLVKTHILFLCFQNETIQDRRWTWNFNPHAGLSGSRITVYFSV